MKTGRIIWFIKEKKVKQIDMSVKCLEESEGEFISFLLPKQPSTFQVEKTTSSWFYE